MANRKILFIGPHRPNRSPSQRFRMEQFFPYLEQAGFECDYSWFIDEKDDEIFYSAGHWLGKLGVFMKAIRVRLSDMMRRNNYDVIFIQREAFITGSLFFEKQFRKSRAKLIYDFDDAIWLEDISSANKNFQWLKRPGKTNEIIEMSDVVIAGNSFLAEHALQFNRNVHIVPTVIDTSISIPTKKKSSRSINIGWSGSHTTQKHFELIVPVLKNLKNKLGDGIHFIKIGGDKMSSDALDIENIPWNIKSEMADLGRIDIGLMPLSDDDWSRGKCGFKALLYMALEIPPVISPVGMNKEIVEHGVNGLLATTEKEWIENISELVESEAMRKVIGKKARQTVIEKYSVNSYVEEFIRLLRE